MIVLSVLIVPLTTAAILMALWTHPEVRRVIAVLGSLAHLGAAGFLFNAVAATGPISFAVGSWPAPFGIEFRADFLGASMALVTALVGLVINLYTTNDLDEPRRRFGFHPLVFVLLAGLSGAFTTNDLFNLFVWFECILLSSFVLLSLGGEKQQIRGGINYVVPNLFSSMLFLTGLGLIYGATGTLNMDHLGTRTGLVEPGLMTGIAALFLTAFGLKAALFPFFAWLPTSYHTPPFAVSAIFAGLLTKVGVFALIRFFTKVWPEPNVVVTTVLLWLSIGGLVVAGVAAMRQTTLRRSLGYLLVSHIGFLTGGLALGSPTALAMVNLYMAHHMIVICGLYLVAGLITSTTGSESLTGAGGLAKSHPLIAWLLGLGFLALAGIPPFSGFAPKVGLIVEAFRLNQPALVVGMLLSSLFTIFCLAKLWMVYAWQPSTEKSPALHPDRLRLVATTLLCASMVGLSLALGPVTQLASQSQSSQEGSS